MDTKQTKTSNFRSTNNNGFVSSSFKWTSSNSIISFSPSSFWFRLNKFFHNISYDAIDLIKKTIIEKFVFVLEHGYLSLIETLLKVKEKKFLKYVVETNFY